MGAFTARKYGAAPARLQALGALTRAGVRTCGYGRIVRKKIGSLVAALVLVSAAVLGATPAHAATVTFDYVLDGTEPTSSRPFGTFRPCFPPTGSGYHYRTQALTVDVDGDYVFWDNRFSTPGLTDGAIAIYSAFDPAVPDSGCLATFDDNHPAGLAVPLTAGTTYTILQTSYTSGVTGSFQFSASGPGTVTVGAPPASTTTSLAVAPNPATVGSTVTLTATVTGASPSGDVEFFADGVSLGTAPLVNGIASLPVSSLATGTHAITATYSGDSGNVSSSTTASVPLTVNPTPTTVTPTPPARVETAA